MEDLQERLNNVRSKITYLKAEKDRIEKEQEALKAELAKEGITDVAQLPIIIEERKQKLEETISKFTENLGKFEVKVASLENKVK